MSELSEFWENKIGKWWKHFSECMPADKIERTKLLFSTHTLPYITISESSSVLDWGCGGGLLTKELVDVTSITDISLVDISKESLERAEKYIGSKCQKHHLSENISDMNVGKDIDLLICYSVIQHFPSHEYWKSVSQYWKEIQPKYISIRTKIAEETREAKTYYKKTDFLRGLVLSVDDLKSPFLEEYDVVYEHKELSKSKQLDLFVVMKRRL